MMIRGSQASSTHARIVTEHRKITSRSLICITPYPEECGGWKMILYRQDWLKSEAVIVADRTILASLCSGVWRLKPVDKFHSFAVSSQLAETAERPSGQKTIELTRWVWPTSVLRHSPVPEFQSRTSPSASPEINAPPSRE